ncbi:hypothetical protein MRX96_054105 [Rhipicephalus microplus]
MCVGFHVTSCRGDSTQAAGVDPVFASLWLGGGRRASGLHFSELLLHLANHDLKIFVFTLVWGLPVFLPPRCQSTASCWGRSLSSWTLPWLGSPGASLVGVRLSRARASRGVEPVVYWRKMGLT